MAIIIASALFLAAFAVLDHSPGASAAGDTGTPNTDWYYDNIGNSDFWIGDADEFAGLATLVNGGTDDFNGKTIGLTGDIDLSPYNAGSGWDPIGDNSHKFNGTFDGGNNVVTNLVIDTTINYSGLFGYVGTYGKVKNIGIVGGSVNGKWDVGGVAGANAGLVQNCYNTGSVSSSFTTSVSGGVVGENIGTVSNCYNTGNVVGDYPGGVVGWNGSGIITGCYNTGNVSKNGDYSIVGGVVGWSNNIISNCYNTGSVSGNDDHGVGGVVGRNNGTVSNCYYNTDKFSGVGIGNWISDTTGMTTVEMTNGTLLGQLNAGGGTAFVMPDHGSNGCLLFYPELTVFAIGGTDFDKEVSKNSVSTYGCTLGPNEQYFTEGNGTYTDPYQIYTAEQLNHVREHLGTGVYFKLMNDIDLADWNLSPGGTAYTDGSGWTPIGDLLHPFNGNFDGNNCMIQNITIDTSATYVGMFEFIGSDGTVENLGIIGNSVIGISGWAIGGVVGLNYGTVQYCYNAGTVSSNDTFAIAGGMVGLNYGTIQYCYNAGTVSGYSGWIGGMVGENKGMVQHCYNTGSVSCIGNSSAVGGMVGENKGMVQYCYNTGSVTCGNSSTVGGVAGWNTNGTVQYCYNAGPVTGGNSSTVGGVAGWNYVACTVQNCYYNTDISSLNGIGIDDSGNADMTICLTTAQMIDPNVLNAGGYMDQLGGGVFEKRTKDDDFCYYPELDAFFTGTDQQQTDSQNSVAVGRRIPILSASMDPIYQGWTLNDSNLSVTATDPISGDTVEGTFAWDDGGITPQVSDSGIMEYVYVFTPSSELYLTASGTMTVTVNQNIVPPANKYYITAASDENSSITPSGVIAVQSGGKQMFEFSAPSGYSITSVTVDGKSLTQDQISAGRYTFSNVVSNHMIYVASTHNSTGNATLSINIVQGKGYAEHRFSGGSDFTTYASAVIIPLSSDVVVRAYADEGYHFVKWVTPSTHTTMEVTLANMGTSMHLDLYFEENGGSDSSLLLVAALLIILLALCMAIWYLFFRRRYYDVVKINSVSVRIIGSDKVRRKSEYRFSVEGVSSGMVSYRIGEGGQWKTLKPDMKGGYVISGKEVISKITIELR